MNALRSVSVLALVSIVLFSPTPLPAATINWATAVDGLWEDATKWSTGIAPTNGDICQLVPAGSYTVSITNSTADTAPQTMRFARLVMGNGGTDDPLVLISYTNGAEFFHTDLLLGSYGLIRLEQGAFDLGSGENRVGEGAGTDGTLTVNGGTFSVTNNGRWKIGSSGGKGTMIVNGGQAILGPTILTCPTGNGRGLLRVSGGTVDVRTNPSVGGSAGGTGTIVVTSGALNMYQNNNQVVFGASTGDASLIVSNGTVKIYIAAVGQGSSTARYMIHGGTNVITRRLDLASGAGATTTMTMEGGLLVATNESGVNDSSTIGDNGTGTFTMSGGEAHIARVEVGDGAGSVGQWTIAGGTATVAVLMRIGDAANATGTVTVAGGTLNANADLYPGNLGIGKLIVSNGTFNGTTMRMLSGTSRTFIHGGTSTVSSLFWFRGGARALMTGGDLDITGTLRFDQFADHRFTVSNGNVTVSKADWGVDPAGSGTWSIMGGACSVTNLFRINRPASVGVVDVAGPGELDLHVAPNAQDASRTFIITNRAGGTIRFVGLDNPPINMGSGVFVVTNATMGFKNTSAANLAGDISTDVTYQGDATLQLDSATNASAAGYSFGPGQDFQNLELVNSGVFVGSGTTLDSTSQLTIKLGGTGNSDIGRLEDAGTLTLGSSTLTITLADGFEPQNGDSFDILDGTISGTFSVLDLPAGPSWNTARLYTDGILDVRASGTVMWLK